tara:strand:+ start:18512 stop:19339 length:828 start_codon:yes stop_codon:yes gene_type:complete
MSKHWKKDYEKQLSLAEKSIYPMVRKYYESNYFKGVDNFIASGNTNYISLFNYGELEKLYIDMYETVAMRFAKWYARYFDKYEQKGTDPNKFITIWLIAFNNYAKQNAATNVVLVSGTAKKSLIKITQRLMSDPDFATLGADERARILRKQFKRYSRFQALRLVRTESARAGNYGIEQSALKVYAGRKLKKRWMTSMDGRERAWHGAANGQEVDFDKPFLVDGEYMQRPGEGSARNVVNCRCSMFPFPVPEPANPLAGLGNVAAGLIAGELLTTD